jgi:cell division protein FtsB
VNGSNDLGLFLMLVFLVAVFGIFVWFGAQILKVPKRERSSIVHALEKNRKLLATNKITSEEFETIKRGLENS